MSRNKREGKFIPGWCYNPSYKVVAGKLVAKVRAGGKHTLVAVRMFNDGGFIIPGITYVRYIQQGAFE